MAQCKRRRDLSGCAAAGFLKAADEFDRQRRAKSRLGYVKEAGEPGHAEAPAASDVRAISSTEMPSIPRRRAASTIFSQCSRPIDRR